MKRNRPLNLEKRKAILKASIQEFYKNGFEGSSMDNISKEANVSKATVYNHFKNKEELFLEIANILKLRMDESFHYSYDKNQNIDNQLMDMARKELDFLSCEENITLIQIVTVVMIQKNDVGEKLLSQMSENCMLMASQWFEEAKKDNKLDFESSSFLSTQFIGMIKSFAFYPQLYGAPILSKKEGEEVIKAAVHMITSTYGK